MEIKMKIRNGFVSNSSSSSFVVILKEEPKDVDHLHRLLHNTDEDIKYVYNTWDDKKEEYSSNRASRYSQTS